MHFGAWSSNSSWPDARWAQPKLRADADACSKRSAWRSGAAPKSVPVRGAIESRSMCCRNLLCVVGSPRTMATGTLHLVPPKLRCVPRAKQQLKYLTSTGISVEGRRSLEGGRCELGEFCASFSVSTSICALCLVTIASSFEIRTSRSARPGCSSTWCRSSAPLKSHRRLIMTSSVVTVASQRGSILAKNAPALSISTYDSDLPTMKSTRLDDLG